MNNDNSISELENKDKKAKKTWFSGTLFFFVCFLLFWDLHVALFPLGYFN